MSKHMMVEKKFLNALMWRKRHDRCIWYRRDKEVKNKRGISAITHNNNSYFLPTEVGTPYKTKVMINRQDKKRQGAK